GCGVDGELAAQGSARARVALAEHARRATDRACPDHHEVPRGIGRHGRALLVTRRGGVDAELRTEGRAGAGVALAEDAAIRPVLSVALPHDHEVSGGVRAYGRKPLGGGGVGIGAELGTERDAGGGEPLAEHAVARAILIRALPDDDEIARGIRGDRKRRLAARREGVRAEFGPERRSGAGVTLTEATEARPG